MGLKKHPHKRESAVARFERLYQEAQRELELLKREFEELKAEVEEARRERKLVAEPTETWRDRTVVPEGHPDYHSMYSDFGPK